MSSTGYGAQQSGQRRRLPISRLGGLRGLLEWKALLFACVRRTFGSVTFEGSAFQLYCC